MQCPKCAAPCADSDTECPRCGVIFAKLARRPVPPGQDDPPPPVPGPQARPERRRAPRAVVVARGALVAGLVIWTWRFASAPMGVAVADSVLHLPNLVFHEAGHVILAIFGRFVSVLGGSLFQVVLPLGLAAAFLVQRDPFGAAICTWWSGQNLLDVAPYIADARALQLVLLGGRTGAEVEGHDWEHLLGEMNLLHMDTTLGLAAHRAGLAVMCAALVWAALSASRARGGCHRESVGSANPPWSLPGLVIAPLRAHRPIGRGLARSPHLEDVRRDQLEESSG